MSIVFTPLLGISFGGCSAEQFCLELNSDTEISYLLKKGMPHEFNHLIYEELRKTDKDRQTALSQTIDEGFSCYFTWVFYNNKMSKHEAVEIMTEDNWNWYLKNEKEIFLKTKAYFSATDGNNPLLRNSKFKLFPDAPKTLNYWLGFRIIESYVKIHGKNSWKDVYKLPASTIYANSGYEAYIKTLN